MVVGVLKLTLFLPENHSLKGKRGVLNKIKARVANTFNVSIAECEDQDLWQRAVLGVCQVGTDAGYVDGALRQVVRFIDDLHVAEVGEEEIEFLHVLSRAARARPMSRRTDRVADAIQALDRRAAAARHQGSAHRHGDASPAWSVSPDLRHARVYFSVLGDDAAARAVARRPAQRRRLHPRADRPPAQPARRARARLRVRPQPRAGRAPRRELLEGIADPTDDRVDERHPARRQARGPDLGRRRAARQAPLARCKVGHLGTLDPFATGLLPLCLGEATKIAQFLNTADKRYDGVIRLGAATDTGDRTGTVVRDGRRAGPIDAAALARGLRSASPARSARGRRCTPRSSATACRSTAWRGRGSRSSASARPVRIDPARAGVGRAGAACASTSPARRAPTCACWRRTSAPRSGTAAHLGELRRTAFGDFTHRRRPSPSRPCDPGAAARLSSRCARPLAHLPAVSSGRAAASQAVRQGKSGVLARLAGASAPTPRPLVDPDGQLAAVVVREQRPMALRPGARRPAALHSECTCGSTTRLKIKRRNDGSSSSSVSRSWWNSSGSTRPTRARPKSRSRC